MRVGVGFGTGWRPPCNGVVLGPVVVFCGVIPPLGRWGR